MGALIRKGLQTAGTVAGGVVAGPAGAVAGSAIGRTAGGALTGEDSMEAASGGVKAGVTTGIGAAAGGAGIPSSANPAGAAPYPGEGSLLSALDAPARAAGEAGVAQGAKQGGFFGSLGDIFGIKSGDLTLKNAVKAGKSGLEGFKSVKDTLLPQDQVPNLVGSGPVRSALLEALMARRY